MNLILIQHIIIQHELLARHFSKEERHHVVLSILAIDSLNDQIAKMSCLAAST